MTPNYYGHVETNCLTSPPAGKPIALPSTPREERDCTEGWLDCSAPPHAVPAIKQLGQIVRLLITLRIDLIVSAKVNNEDQCQDLFENDSALHCCLACFLRFLRSSQKADSETDETLLTINKRRN